MIKIPKKVLELDTEGGEKVAPSVGDEVDLKGFTGKVASEDGEDLVIDLVSYNGAPVSYAEKQVESEGDDHEEKEKKDLLEMMSKETEED